MENSAGAVERILANAGKCLLRHGCGGQFRLRREKIADRGETVDSDQGGAVEKPLVGRMAFTPLTRGARGVGFQPREGERDGFFDILPCHEPPSPVAFDPQGGFFGMN